jgi:hypothetical protein
MARAQSPIKVHESTKEKARYAACRDAPRPSYDPRWRTQPTQTPPTHVGLPDPSTYQTVRSTTDSSMGSLALPSFTMPGFDREQNHRPLPPGLRCVKVKAQAKKDHQRITMPRCANGKGGRLRPEGRPALPGHTGHPALSATARRPAGADPARHPGLTGLERLIHRQLTAHRPPRG